MISQRFGFMQIMSHSDLIAKMVITVLGCSAFSLGGLIWTLSNAWDSFQLSHVFAGVGWLVAAGAFPLVAYIVFMVAFALIAATAIGRLAKGE